MTCPAVLTPAGFHARYGTTDDELAEYMRSGLQWAYFPSSGVAIPTVFADEFMAGKLRAVA
jgi:hypothetical protein